MRMCGGFIILSDLCGREGLLDHLVSKAEFLSDLCGREVKILDYNNQTV